MTVQLTQHRGLHPRMKELLQPLIEAKKFKMTRALRVLREAGWLKNWNEKGFARKITGQVKGYCKRERRKRREGFWKGSYGEFASVVASRLLDDKKIEEMVEAGEYDRFVVLTFDISGDKKTTFYVGATIRSLSYAPVQELGRGFAWATTDGTGRCNYNGKIVIFVGTVCGQGRVRLIGSMLLSKGETTNEIAQGLKCLADAIRVVHKTFLRMLTTVPFRDGLYDATALGSDYKWRPLITMNDNSDAIFHAWAEVLRTPSPTPPAPRAAERGGMELDHEPEPEPWRWCPGHGARNCISVLPERPSRPRSGPPRHLGGPAQALVGPARLPWAGPPRQPGGPARLRSGPSERCIGASWTGGTMERPASGWNGEIRMERWESPMGRWHYYWPQAGQTARQAADPALWASPVAWGSRRAA